MINDLDRAIIHELEMDARQSTEKIGNKLGVSPSTIRRRIIKLVNADILRFNATINPRYTGNNIWALLQINVKLGLARQVAATLAQHNCTHFISVCMGRYDVLAYVSLPSTEELDRFINAEMATIDSITNCEVLLLTMPEKYSKNH